MAAPTTLQQAILFFSDYANCHRAVMAVRWPDGVVKCPRCGSDNVTYLENARVWKCYEKHPRAKFSLKVGTVFEDSPLPLQKWLPALWLLTNCKNGISSYELGRALGVTQKSAWFMLHRLRLALQAKGGGMLGGEVEIDETYIGGKARNMHKRVRDRRGISQGTSMAGKVAVMGLLERRSAKGTAPSVSKSSPDGSDITCAHPSKSMWSAGPTSTPIRSARTPDSARTTPTTLSTTRKSTWRGTSTPTAARTSGAC